MKCPACTSESLSERLTSAGVVVDHCPHCNGLWLDQGEVFLFSKEPLRLHEALVRCFEDGRPTERHCPRCSVPMNEGPLNGPGLTIDHCPRCYGLWLDDEELARVVGESPRKFGLEFSKGETASKAAPEREVYETKKVELKPTSLRRKVASIPAKMSPLPNLFMRAAGAMAFLYTLLALALIVIMEYFRIPPKIILIAGVGAAAFQFMLGPFMMDLSLRFLFRCNWVDPEELPRHLREFIVKVTGEQGMKFPWMGIIEDGAPNAFTYGHRPNNARIVITRGLFDLLDEEEVEAVVAHEIGHAKHWDMLLMTVAALVPLILYYIFRSISEASSRMSKKSSSKDSSKAAGMVFIIAMGIYLAYILAQYVVLWFSRTREFYADRFSGEVTRNPNLLASALVKIAYGLAGRGVQEDEKRTRKLEAVGALGIFDANVARAMAFTAYGLTSQASSPEGDREATVSAMQWDMWNPWAKWHQLNSTHPLVANRLQYLGEQSASMGVAPFVIFDRERPESYWDEFFVDLAVCSFPALAVVGSVAGGLLTGDYRLWAGIGLFSLGYSYLITTAFRYRGKVFPPMKVSGLLRKIKVSSVRPVSATLKGRIIGKGVPGLIWSEDFVMRDETGIMLLDYRQPLAIWEWVFGLLRAGQYAGKDVEVTGWYRRSPVPYMELKSITCEGETRRCYVLHWRVVSALVMMAVGVVLALNLVSYELPSIWKLFF